MNGVKGGKKKMKKKNKKIIKKNKFSVNKK